MKKTIIYIIILVIVIAAGVFAAKTFIKNEETKPTSQETADEPAKNYITENNNNTEGNNAVNNENEAEKSNNTEDNETKPVSPVEIAGTDEEKAIAIVKKEWGADDSVNFVFDHKNENGEFVIAVRDSNTTAAIEWYIVNVSTGTCKTR